MSPAMIKAEGSETRSDPRPLNSRPDSPHRRAAEGQERGSHLWQVSDRGRSMDVHDGASITNGPRTARSWAVELRDCRNRVKSWLYARMIVLRLGTNA